MKCDKCGYLLLDGDNFCRNCGKTITRNPEIQPTTVPKQTVGVNNIVKDDNRKANILCIISLLLYFLAPIVLFSLDIIISLVLQNSSIVGFSAFSVLCRIAAFVLMIVARVKYPNSLFAKILMWIYIALIAAGLVFGLLFILILILALLSI